MNKLHFITPDIDENFFSTESKYLYKTMPLENALKTIRKGLWFAKPSTWTDPFEKRFYSAKIFRMGKTPINNPIKDRFLCCCMTSIGQSEAHWNTYSREQIGIQFQFYREKLYSFLCALPTKYQIFIGYAQYQKKDEIKAPITQNSFLSQSFNHKKNEDLAKLLLLKRRAFKYEEEIRFIIANGKREEYKQAGIAINSPQKNFLDTIYAIKISPNCPKETAALLKEHLKQITKNKIKKIFQNHLYDDTERNRTIIISE